MKNPNRAIMNKKIEPTIKRLLSKKSPGEASMLSSTKHLKKNYQFFLNDSQKIKEQEFFILFPLPWYKKQSRLQQQKKATDQHP
jgi:hypothetical protein